MPFSISIVISRQRSENKKKKKARGNCFVLALDVGCVNYLFRFHGGVTRGPTRI